MVIWVGPLSHFQHCESNSLGRMVYLVHTCGGAVPGEEGDRGPEGAHGDL